MEHDVLSALSNYDVDFVVTMNDLVDQVKEETKYTIGIEDLMNKGEIKEKLEKYLKETEEV